jgi:hypothetical protein
MSYNAYAKNVKTMETPSETDAFVLEQAAYKLSQLKVNQLDWADTLRHNMSIWTVLQAFVMGDESYHLPLEIRNNIFNLSRFVDKRTFALLGQTESERDTTMLDVLININTNIALGLRGNPGTGG